MSSSKKKRVLVTGGLGFIGSHVVERLKNHYDIIVIDIDTSETANELSQNWRNEGIKVYQKDISHSETWNNIEKCDFIFHGAAQTSAEASKKEKVILQDFDTNLRGTFLVAEYARRYNSKIIFCNTIRSYAPEYIDAATKANKMVDETFPTIVHSKLAQPPFAISKYFGEEYLRFYCQNHDIQVISHRMSGVMGPGQIGKDIHGWVSYIVKCAVKEQPYAIYGDGQQSRDILHINDFVDLIEMEMNDFQRFCDIGFVVYNIGGGPENEIKLIEIINTLKHKHHLSLDFSKEDPREGEPKHYVSCLDKITKKGWPINHQLIKKADIIDELVRWCQGRK